MQKLILSLLLTLAALTLLTACGGEDVADEPNLSEENKTIVEEIGGPFSASEFKDFLKDLPSIPGLTAESQKDLGEMRDEILPAAILAKVKDLGWKKERFMYMYSHTLTMINMEQMKAMSKQMAAQMDGMPEEQKKVMEQMMGQKMGGQMEAYKAEVDKLVPTSEQEIILDNMGELRSLFGIQ